MRALLIGILLALVALLGYAKYKTNQELDRVHTICMAKSKDALQCNCFISEIKHDTTFLYEYPLLGQLIQPSDAEGEKILEDAWNTCFD